MSECIPGDIFDPALLSNPAFIIICLSNLVGMMGFNIPFVFIADAAVTMTAVDKEAASLLVSCIGEFSFNSTSTNATDSSIYIKRTIMSALHNMLVHNVRVRAMNICLPFQASQTCSAVYFSAECQTLHMSTRSL